MLEHIGQASAIGTPEQAARQVRGFIARTGADEVIFAGPTYDPAHREAALARTLAVLAEGSAQS